MYINQNYQQSQQNSFKIQQQKDARNIIKEVSISTDKPHINASGKTYTNL